MDIKKVGYILIGIAILLAILVFSISLRDEAIAQAYVEEYGSCVTDEGICLHDEKNTTFFFGSLFVLGIGLFGIYLAFFDKSQKLMAKQHQELSSALIDSKIKDEFKAFLAGFEEKEQKVLKIIQEQEGIKQSTIRFKAGMSKAGLSVMLKGFEDKGIIHREESGKSKKVFLKKVY
jgi:DNA-binding MarR family transcriptional regulator